MKWNYWSVIVLLFLLVNEYLSMFLLAVFIGGMEFSDAYIRTFEHSSLKGYFFASAFRTIPYIALALFVIKSNVIQFRSGKIILWILPFALAAFHLFGYWGMQYSLFTSAHTSSTSFLALIFLPIWALILGCIGYPICFFTFKAYRLFNKSS